MNAAKLPYSVEITGRLSRCPPSCARRHPFSIFSEETIILPSRFMVPLVVSDHYHWRLGYLFPRPTSYAVCSSVVSFRSFSITGVEFRTIPYHMLDRRFYTTNSSPEMAVTNPFWIP